MIPLTHKDQQVRVFQNLKALTERHPLEEVAFDFDVPKIDILIFRHQRRLNALRITNCECSFFESQRTCAVVFLAFFLGKLRNM